MRIQPKRLVYSKQFKGGTATFVARGVIAGCMSRGTYGLVAIEGGRRSARQRAKCRRTRRHGRRRQGKVWWSGHTGCPVTRKPRAVRIGKGKGPVVYWARHVRPGHVRVEVLGGDETRIKLALRGVGCKRPIATKVVCVR